MNINWEEYAPSLRERLAREDPALAEDLERWKKSLEVPELETPEQRHEKLEAIKNRYRAIAAEERKKWRQRAREYRKRRR